MAAAEPALAVPEPALVWAEPALAVPEPALVWAEPALVAAEPAFDGQGSSPAPERPYGWRIAIYPAMAWVPIFGTSVSLPPAPSHPTAPGASGSTNSSFNGAYFGGGRFEMGKWSADGLFMWTALSASRTTPFVNVNLDFVFGDAHVGYEVFPNLYLEGGFRRLSLDFTAKVGSDSGSASPGFWDPLVGLTYRRPLGKKWRVLFHGDGGGFGVGSDVDVTASGRAEWQFARHFGMTMGYGGMHFSDSSSGPRGTLSIGPTLHGPIFGVGVYF
jgi:hypothetical protein